MTKIVTGAALTAAMVFAFGATGWAQTPTQIKGKLKSIAADGAVVVTPQGEASVGLAPDWKAMIVAPASLADIKDGSFIGTTNVDNGTGGRSVEVHVFPPGVKVGEGQRVMDATTGTKMTNGTIGKVVSSPVGPQFDVVYPGGVRHVTVPKDALITTMTPVDHNYLKAGMSVSMGAVKGADGKMVARFISTGPNGSPPAR